MVVTFLSAAPLDAEALAAKVTTANRGGVVSFIGVVRDHHGGRAVLSLDYSAYGPMAEGVCAAIVREAEDRWPVGVALAHRVGALQIGDAAVVVVAASAHRDVAFDACRYVIEEVKTRVPIWKRERYADGTEAWVDPTAASGVHPVSSA